MTLAPERPVAERPLAGCPRRRPLLDYAGQPPAAGAAGAESEGSTPPRLAEGVQLLGEYAGTGYVEPQYLARRPGGQLVQLSPLLHQVAEACDGISTEEEIAERVSRSYGKTVSADNVRTVVETKLRPLGVLAAADGTSPPVESSDPLLALKLRTQLLPPGGVRAVARLAHPLFWPPVICAVMAGLGAVDVWLFAIHGVGSGLRSTVQRPAVFLLLVGVVIVSAALHELGHAAACSYGGARPGGMGAGIYVVWPAFYTDVTEAYRLDRRGRLRTDLGGVYVNAIIVIATAAVYFRTHFEPLVLACVLLQMQVLQQLLPFLRLDGYYVLSDLVGVPDLFRRIGPVLRSTVPFRHAEPAVTELRPWVRRVVAGWVFVLVPLIALNLGYFLLAAPRILATSWDSGSRFVGTMMTAKGTPAVWAGVQLLLLLLPVVGAAYTTIRVGRRGTVRAWRWSAGSTGRRLAVLTGGLGLLALLGFTWFPDGRLSPYLEGERGTVQQHARELRNWGIGAPVLRSPREAQEPLPPYDKVDRTGRDGLGSSQHQEQSRQPKEPSSDRDTPTATPTSSEPDNTTTGSSDQSTPDRSSSSTDSPEPTSTRSDDDSTDADSDSTKSDSRDSDSERSPSRSREPEEPSSTRSSESTPTRSRTSTSTRSPEPTSTRSASPTSTRSRDTEEPTSDSSQAPSSTRLSAPTSTASEDGSATSTRSSSASPTGTRSSSLTSTGTRSSSPSSARTRSSTSSATGTESASQ